MKKNLKSFLVVVLAIATGVGNCYVYQSHNNANNALLMENIEAMSQTEPGAIEHDYCVESHSNSIWATGSLCICASGTPMGYGVPKNITNPEYPCSGPTGKWTVNTRMGYCYRPINN